MSINMVSDNQLLTFVLIEIRPYGEPDNYRKVFVRFEIVGCRTIPVVIKPDRTDIDLTDPDIQYECYECTHLFWLENCHRWVGFHEARIPEGFGSIVYYYGPYVFNAEMPTHEEVFGAEQNEQLPTRIIIIPGRRKPFMVRDATRIAIGERPLH